MSFRKGALAADSEIQIELTLFNRARLTPSDQGVEGLFPAALPERRRDFRIRCAEAEFLAEDRQSIAERAAEASRDAEGFVAWFEALKENGPGQGDPLFPYLAESATREEMRWFLSQEVAGEAGFDDLVALTQLRMPTPVKLELARNYWDEMGRGREAGMHGPMLAKLAEEMEIGPTDLAKIVPEALALGNLMVGLAYHRETAYHSLGCLGAVELTAPGRAKKVYEGLRRLGISPAGQRYYLLHSTLDVHHSVQWNREALLPLVREKPEAARSIAEGALMRLRAGDRCFARYRRELGWVETRAGAAVGSAAGPMVAGLTRTN